MAESNPADRTAPAEPDQKSNVSASSSQRTHWGIVLVALAVFLAVGILAGRYSLATWCKSQARHHLDHFRYAEALDTLQFTEKWGIDDAEVHFLKARLFRKTGKFDAFNESLATARTLGLSEARMENEKLLLLGQSGNIGKLLEELENLAGGVEQFDPPEVYESLISGLLLNGRFGEAMEYLESWGKDFPDDPNQKFYQAMLLKRYGPSRNIRNALEQASELLQEVTSEYPRHYRARMTHGEILLELNQAEQAARQFEACLDNPDTGAQAKVMLASSYAELGRLADAMELYQQALEIDPDHLIARMELGKLLFNEGEFEEALVHLEKVYPRRSWDYDLGFSLARTLEAVGRSEEAQKIFARATEVQSKRDEIQDLMAEVDVVRDEEKRFQLGQLLLDYGNPELGVIYLKSLLDVNPNHQGAKLALDEYYRNQSRKNSDVSLFPSAVPQSLPQ